MKGLLAAVLLAVPISLLGTHIVGGDLTYEDLGSGQLLVTLTLYRDCGPTNTNGVGFDTEVEIGVFDDQGAHLFSEFFPFTTSDTVPVQLNNPCLSVTPTICVERAAYSGVIQLPGTGGFSLAYQRCCRTPATVNVQAPNTQGLTCSILVPPASLGPNDSPVFNDYPPIAMCVGEPFVFDHSASDADGDSLVYGLCTPLNGGSSTDPTPSPPGGPPYTPIAWGAGFSQNAMMNASPQLMLDPVSGLLTVTPNLIGSYAVGLCVSEYRNGTLLSTVTRDLRFDVVPCQVTLVSSIQQQQTFCAGLTVDFVNQSVNSGSYFWDFGEPLISTDTSSLFAPSHTFQDTGSYTVMLIAEPGWPCADTSYSTFTLYPPLDPVFADPGPLCFSDLPVELDASGSFTSSAVIDWDLGPAGAPGQLTGDPVQASFSSTGSHPITLTVTDLGCTEVFEDSITVFADPTVDFSGGGSGCMPFGTSFQQLATSDTPLFFSWDLGDGTVSSDPDPQHVYLQPGSYDVRLTVRTDSGCVDTVSWTVPAAVTVHPVPEAAFEVFPPTTNVFDPTVALLDGSLGGVAWTYLLDGTTYEGPQVMHTFSDGGEFTVLQVVTSAFGCMDTTARIVQVLEELLYVPNAFTPDGDGINDVFLPSVLGAQGWDLEVIDRWGQILFRSDDPSKGWDGEGAIPGVYAFRIRYSALGAAPRDVLGSITLVR